MTTPKLVVCSQTVAGDRLGLVLHADEIEQRRVTAGAQTGDPTALQTALHVEEEQPSAGA